MENKTNWSDFPIFLAVIESGSLSGAARTLNVSQPTVGRRMSALEQQIGVPLLHKTSSGLAPTEMGILVLEHVQKMDREAEAITRTTAAQDQILAGDVTISASEGIGDIWLPLALNEFHRANRQIRIVIDVSAQAVNLARREADIALRWLGPGNQNSLIGRKVITTGFGLYAARDYLEQYGTPQTYEDLANHHAVSVQLGEYSPIWPINQEEISIIPKHVAFRSNSFHTHEMAITCGYGIGSLPHVQAVQSSNVERVLPQYNHLQDLWIVAHDDLSRNKRIRLVFDYLIKALLRDQEYFLTGLTDPWGRQPAKI